MFASLETRRHVDSGAALCLAGREPCVVAALTGEWLGLEQDPALLNFAFLQQLDDQFVERQACGLITPRNVSTALYRPESATFSLTYPPIAYGGHYAVCWCTSVGGRWGCDTNEDFGTFVGYLNVSGPVHPSTVAGW